MIPDGPRFEDDAVEDRLSKPNTKAGRLQRHVLALYVQHLRDGALPTSGRFVFYELEDAGIVPKKYYDEDGNEKKRKPNQDVSDALTKLREKGLVPWEDIVDETRSLDEWNYAPSVPDFVRAATEAARIDLWAGEKPPLILCESRSLAGVLRPTARTYLTPIASTNGQTGGFLHSDVAPLVKGGRRVLYLGDYDLSGQQIEDNTRRVLEDYGWLDWERVALTDVQGTRARLPGLRRAQDGQPLQPAAPLPRGGDGAAETGAAHQHAARGAERGAAGAAGRRAGARRVTARTGTRGVGGPAGHRRRGRVAPTGPGPSRSGLYHWSYPCQ